jgi:hypothetical protein
LNFLNIIPELEKLPKIKKKRNNLKTFFSRSKSLQRRRNFREKKKDVFKRKSCKTIKHLWNRKHENWSVLNFLNTVLEEKAEESKRHSNL